LPDRCLYFGLLFGITGLPLRLQLRQYSASCFIWRICWPQLADLDIGGQCFSIASASASSPASCSRKANHFKR
jgi:hypothetical protein